MSLFDVKQHQMRCSKGDLRNIYSINQVNGQLIATFKHVRQPGRGTEIFIKRIPRDILLQEVLEFVIQCGDIYRIRLLMEFSGYNRGYCFVTYFDTSSARKAVVTLNGSDIRKQSPVIVKISFDNNKLEMRGIPRGIKREDIHNTLLPIVGTGLKRVLTFEKKKEKPTKKCVLKYDTHRNALEARRKLFPKCKLWGKIIEADWAVPNEVLNATRLFFKDVPPHISKVQIYDDVTKYVKPESLLNMFLQDGIGYLLFISGSIAFDAYMSLRSKKICGEYFKFSFTKFYSHLPDDEELAAEGDNFEEQVEDPEKFNNAPSSNTRRNPRDSPSDSGLSADENLSAIKSADNNTLPPICNTTSVDKTQSSNTRRGPKDSSKCNSLSAEDNVYAIESTNNVLPPIRNTTSVNRIQSPSIRRNQRDSTKYDNVDKTLPAITSTNNSILSPIYISTSVTETQPSNVSDGKVSSNYNSLSAAGQLPAITTFVNCGTQSSSIRSDPIVSSKYSSLSTDRQGSANNNVSSPIYNITSVDRAQSCDISDPRDSSKNSTLSADGNLFAIKSADNILSSIHDTTTVNGATDNSATSAYNAYSVDTWAMQTESTVSENDFPGALYAADYIMDTVPAWGYCNLSSDDISHWAMQTGSAAIESIPAWGYNLSSDDASQWAVQEGSTAMETIPTWDYNSATGDPTSLWMVPSVQTGYSPDVQSVGTNMVAIENLNLMNYTIPHVVVPPPVVTLPGPYNEAEVIHNLVREYVNFNHATSQWIYASANEMLIPCLSSNNVVRVLPTINHIQYDLILVQVTRGM